MGQGDDSVRLRAALDQLAELLSSVGEEEASVAVGQARARIDRGEAAGFDDVVRMIGRPGDGGLNDLVIHPSRGHVVDDDDDLDEINQRLGFITATSFRLAARLGRQLG